MDRGEGRDPARPRAATSSPTCSTTRCTTAARPRDARRHRRQAAAARRVPDAERGHLRDADMRRSAGARRCCSDWRAAAADGERLPRRPSTSCCAIRCARFVAREVEPHGLAWKRGHDAARGAEEVGAAGLLGLMYERANGGARPTRSPTWCSPRRCAIDFRRLRGHRARPYRHGEPAPAPRGSRRRRRTTCPAGSRARRSLRGDQSPAPARTSPASARGRARGRRQRVDPERQQLFITKACSPTSTSSPQDGEGRTRCRCSSSRRTLGFSRRPRLDKSGWLSSNTAEPCSRTAASRRGPARRGRTGGFDSVMKNFKTERIVLAAMARLPARPRRSRRRWTACASGGAFGAHAVRQAGLRQRLAMLDAKGVPARAVHDECAWRSTGARRLPDVSMQGADRRAGRRGRQAAEQFNGGASAACVGK